MALVYDGLVNRGLGGERTAALQRWVAVCATTPAALMGFTRKGRLLPGYDADIVVFDPNVDITISPESLHETAGWSPYSGTSLRGWPTTTISRGEILVDDGEWRGAAGHGRFVAR